MAASLIGCLGQAHFPFCFLGLRRSSGSRFSSQSGLAFERAPLHACVGLEVESPAFRRASSCAADIFGFIHEPRPDWTIPSDWLDGYLFMLHLQYVPDGIHCHRSTYGEAERRVCGQRRQPRGVGPLFA